MRPPQQQQRRRARLVAAGRKVTRRPLALAAVLWFRYSDGGGAQML